MCSLDLSSISPAPLSSQHRGCGAAAHAVTHGDPLSRVLERPRVDDGFGGELTFSEYAALTRLLQWPADMMEDCWCDIVNGIASATIVDVQRAAHYIEAYHNSRKTDKPIEHASGMTEEEAVMPTPTVVVEASPCISTIDVVEVSSCSSMDSTEVGMKKQLVRPTSAPAFPRYALDTFASSIRKVDRPTSASTKMPTAGREADGGVFLRLHAHAKGWNERRAHAVAAAAAAAAMEDIEAPQTHRPTRTSSSRAAKASKPSTAHYQAPTQSYYARLENRRATYDAIEDAPETPRVAFQPAPGPSAEVPNGYVEAVARLRKYVHARHHLREGGDDSRPILRLPLPQRGESLDIRLGADPTARRRGQERKAISVAALVQRMAEPGCEEHTRYT